MSNCEVRVLKKHHTVYYDELEVGDAFIVEGADKSGPVVVFVKASDGAIRMPYCSMPAIWIPNQDLSYLAEDNTTLLQPVEICNLTIKFIVNEARTMV